jgi:hypothetical protein
MQPEKMIYSKSDSTLTFMGKPIMQPVQTNNYVRTLLVVAIQKNIFSKNSKKRKVK